MKNRPPRLYAGADLHPEKALLLEERSAHHLVRVLRLGVGDAVVVFDGQGGEYEGTIASIHRERVTLAIGAHHAVERESPVAVTLAQGISSGEKMDFTVQKAVELGVAAIQPLATERALVRLSGPRAAARLAHWRRIAIAACEQCGRNRVPEVREPLSLDTFCRERGGGAPKLMLAPRGGSSLKEILSNTATALTLAAGPEAGFSDGEQAMLAAAGFAAVRLGPRVLRTETAALAALAAINALQGDF